MEAAGSSLNRLSWRWRKWVPPEYWCLFTILYDAMCQMTIILNVTKYEGSPWTNRTLFFLKLLLYWQFNQTFLLQSTPLHSWYTAPNIFSSSGMHTGTCFMGWSEGPVSNFLLSPLPSEISNLLVRISTSVKRKSPKGPNVESRAAVGQQSSNASSKIHE